MEKRKHLCTVGGNVNWCTHYETALWRSLNKLKIELYDPASPHLCIYPKKTKLLPQRAMCTLMFVAAVHTIARHGNNLDICQQMNR